MRQRPAASAECVENSLYAGRFNPRIPEEEGVMRTRWASEFGWGNEFGWGEADAPGPQTEDSRERGFVSEAVDDQGHADELDPDEVGDIADEGPGRRG